jgi:adenine-specific DNA-methyltransferase
MIKDIIDSNEALQPSDKQINVLKEHFPACFKADGSFDLERFKSEIATKTDVLQEGYELKFLGKSYSKLLASTDTTTVIQPNEVHNQLPENADSQNIYISGDNLDGLKHLLKSYSKSVKCIYIDPPYNTGSDGFVYQDNFNYTRDSLQDKLSISEDEAERILDLTKRGSSSHSAWLMFMYSRLLLARDLLTDDGVIFISIDDNEQANLKLLCDDVFGEENFVAELIWERAYSPKNDAKFISNSHDYVLMIARDINNYNIGRLERTAEANARYSNPDNDPRGVWKPSDMSVKTYNAEYDYQITTPSGRIVEPPAARCWSLSKNKFFERLQDNRIWFGTEGNSVPSIKRFLSELKFEGMAPTSILFYKDVGHSQEGAKEVVSLFDGKSSFDGPKPVRLIKRVLTLANTEDDSIIIDFFSGSATTAHAVMQLNSEDGGSRKFISVQLPEELNPEVDSQKIAYEFLKENNLPTTLDYIGMERIKRAAAKIKAEREEKAKKKEGELFKDDALPELDMGFKHFVLTEPDQNTLDKLYSFDGAAGIIDKNILDTFGKPTILATWLNADGYGLTATAEEVDLAGFTAYYCQKHLYLIEGNFTLDSMKALLSKYDTEGHFNPENIVMFGYSFSDWSINEMIEKNLRILNDSEKNLKINFAVRY